MAKVEQKEEEPRPEEPKKEEKTLNLKQTREELIGMYYVLANSEVYKKFVEINETLIHGRQINEFLEAVENIIPELKQAP